MHVIRPCSNQKHGIVSRGLNPISCQLYLCLYQSSIITLIIPLPIIIPITTSKRLVFILAGEEMDDRICLVLYPGESFTGITRNKTQQTAITNHATTTATTENNRKR